jgi:RNA polymerase-binding transcription factor DksA
MRNNDRETSNKLCSLCGQAIAAARLEALPGVTTCIDCARKHPRKIDTSHVDISQASQINRTGFAPYD